MSILENAAPYSDFQRLSRFWEN